MKIRHGFVSNSSSSSFIVSMKIGKGEMTEEIISHNRKIFTDYYGKSESEYIDKQMKKHKNVKILYRGSAEYGSEESVENAIEGVLEGLGIDTKKIEIKFDE